MISRQGSSHQGVKVVRRMGFLLQLALLGIAGCASEKDTEAGPGCFVGPENNLGPGQCTRSGAECGECCASLQASRVNFERGCLEGEFAECVAEDYLESFFPDALQCRVRVRDDATFVFTQEYIQRGWRGWKACTGTTAGELINLPPCD